MVYSLKMSGVLFPAKASERGTALGCLKFLNVPRAENGVIEDISKELKNKDGEKFALMLLEYLSNDRPSEILKSTPFIVA